MPHIKGPVLRDDIVQARKLFLSGGVNLAKPRCVERNGFQWPHGLCENRQFFPNALPLLNVEHIQQKSW